MAELFGTDGIRGVANRYPMNVDTALKVGRAVAELFNAADAADGIVIGRDTRLSGSMIEAALTAGICSTGADTRPAGILPTPGVAFLTASLKAAAGLVVSASHNPYTDNGIKVFGPDGFKLSDALEREIERRVFSEPDQRDAPDVADIGRVLPLTDAGPRYLNFLKRALPDKDALTGLRIVIDCANGATSRLAPNLFESLGAATEVLFNRPDGKNINAGCGSQHPEVLAATVQEKKADAGLAFDGDGDRLIAVDETGAVLTGDQILVICARHLKRHAALRNNTVVSTVMSNMGLTLALRRLGITHLTTAVGDRHVMQKMVESGALLGGEDSGHTVFLDSQTTGDGLLTALKLLTVARSENKPLSQLKSVMTVLPQVLINVPVRNKPELATLPAVSAAIGDAEAQLKGRGRVLVRYSGTQPECRVMVEGPTASETEALCQRIADVVRKTIGAKTV
jgi:phosphoglucosamine mutase